MVGEAQPPQKRMFDIPTPVVAVVEDYEKDVSATFELPQHYIRHTSMPKTSLDDEVEYNLDADDLHWLRTHSQFGESGEWRGSLTPDMMERIIDIAEKATGPEGPCVSQVRTVRADGPFQA